MEARRCFNLSLSNWAIQIEQGGEWSKRYREEEQIRKNKMQQESDANDRRISVLHTESTPWNVSTEYVLTDPCKLKHNNCYK